MCSKFDAESLGSVMEAAGRLQIGVFASGPLQEAALLQHSALQVSMSTPQLLHVVDLRHNMRHNTQSVLCSYLQPWERGVSDPVVPAMIAKGDLNSCACCRGS